MRYMMYATDDAFHIIVRSNRIKLETLFNSVTSSNVRDWEIPTLSFLEYVDYGNSCLFMTPFEHVTKHDYVRLIGWYDTETCQGKNADMMVKVSEIKYG